MRADIWRPVQRLMDQAISEAVFPGAAVLVGEPERVLFKQAFGVANRITGEPVTLKTVFDLASLTKPLATTLAILMMVQKGTLSLETCLGAVLPAFRNTSRHAIQIRHLLYHTAGLPAHRDYFRDLIKLPLKERKAALRHLLVKEPLIRPIGAAPEYSDLGFMILCWVIEELTRERLDHYVRENIYRPLGLKTLFFMDLMNVSDSRQQEPFAATEYCSWRKALMAGAVSDDNAWVTGGIDGHAGLFGAVGDVYGLLKVLLSAFHEKNNALFCAELVQAFLKRDAVSSRALGFDTPSAEGSSSGRLFSVNTVGHLGFTGTSFWMDLDREIMVILLTNRIHPDRNNNRIRWFRPILHDAVMGIVLPGRCPARGISHQGEG
jgi:CubicO group peptidase (beta-lactamase class C family)